MTAFVTAISEIAARRPGATAICFGDRRVSYAELAQNARCVAAAVLAAGMPRGTRIGLLDLNSVEYLEAVIGIAQAGCVPVGINSRLAAPELEFVVRDAAMPLLLVGAEHVALVEGVEPRLEGLRCIALAGGHPRWISYQDWCGDVQAPPRLPADGDDLLQLYSSGTTGHPKGACHTLAAWSAWGDMCRGAGWGRYDEQTVMLVCMPLFHIAALGTSLLALESGAQVVLMRRFDPAASLRLIDESAVTDTLMAPAVIAALLAVPEAASARLDSLRQLLYGAAPISEALLARVRERFRCRLTQLYGMTENLGLSTFLPHEDHEPALGRLRSCGRRYSETDLRIVDADGNDLPPGQTGEVLVRGPTLMRGYFNNAEATTRTLRDGWLHTGDAGYLDADGYLFIRDRVRDMIISGGENIYPAEVENALAGHPGLQEAAVIGIPDERWGEAVLAVVVPRAGCEVTLESLREHARGRIAGYKLPVAIAAIEALPRNASGKVLRRELRQPYWAGQDREVH